MLLETTIIAGSAILATSRVGAGFAALIKTRKAAAEFEKTKVPTTYRTARKASQLWNALRLSNWLSDAEIESWVARFDAINDLLCEDSATLALDDLRKVAGELVITLESLELHGNASEEDAEALRSITLELNVANMW
jgi:hypothetical protein